MGQAKKRGTQEQRIAESVRSHLRPVYRGDGENLDLSSAMVFAEEIEQVDRWLATANRVGHDRPNGNAEFSVFKAVLAYIWVARCSGACHSTSAVMYMLMREKGLDPTLCVGEVGAGGKFFDHSWIEVGGAVFDAAVSIPLLRGSWVSAPIFAGIDLDRGNATELRYGAASGQGFDKATQPALELDLSSYSAGAGKLSPFGLAHGLGGFCDVSATMDSLRSKYGATRRVVRCVAA